MAHLMQRSNGTREIRYGRSIYLGRRPLEECELWLSHVQHILDRQERQMPISRETEDWLKTLPPKDLKRLSTKGLCEPLEVQNAKRLFGLLDAFMESKKKLEASSVEVYAKVEFNLRHHFQSNPWLERITEKDADDFWTYLNSTANRRTKGPLAPCTATKRMEQARDIFTFARKKKFLRGDENPFAKQSHWDFEHENPERKVEVPAEYIARVIEQAPSTEWKLFILLSRYQAMRTPSEILRLRWEDVCWDSKEMFLRKSKKKMRKMPIFPEVMPMLERAFDEAEEGAEMVIASIRYEKNPVNYANHMERFLKMAGIVPWPRLWHNLRMTRQSELLDEFPIHTVCEWLGNSVKVAIQHYAKPLRKHHKKATTERTTSHEFV